MMTSRDEAGDANRRAPLELTFRRTISVSAEVRVPGASCKGPQTSADLLGFVPIQFTSTLPNQDSVLFIHVVLLFVNFGSVDGPKLFKRSCLAARQQGIEAAGFH